MKGWQGDFVSLVERKNRLDQDSRLILSGNIFSVITEEKSGNIPR